MFRRRSRGLRDDNSGQPARRGAKRIPFGAVTGAYARLLWGLLAVGLVVRVALAFGTQGVAFDMGSLVLVRDQLADDPLHLYGTLTTDLGEFLQPRWPYPPGFFAWIVPAGWLADVTGLPYHGLVQIPAIAADLALALLVQGYLGRRGAPERTRLAAAGAIALGPSFVAISGHHGQIDSLAILPAVAALVLWERGGARRGLVAGLLLGLGAAIKTVPALVAMALLPTARSAREAVTVVGAAILVPVALLVPFLLADDGTLAAVGSYHGAPGVGGLSLLLQPDLATFWLAGAPVERSAASELLFDHGIIILIVALAGAGAFLARYRPPPAQAAVVVWLTVYAFSPNLFLQYAVWGLPFLLLAGYVWQVAAVQLALLAPTLIVYTGPVSEGLALYVYVPLIAALWLATVAGLIGICRGIARREGLRDLGRRSELAHVHAR
jgi:hypothetical protein